MPSALHLATFQDPSTGDRGEKANEMGGNPASCFGGGQWAGRTQVAPLMAVGSSSLQRSQRWQLEPGESSAEYFALESPACLLWAGAPVTCPMNLS